jgi:hypothetical protein
MNLVRVDADTKELLRGFAHRDHRTEGQIIKELVKAYGDNYKTARKPLADPRGRPKAVVAPVVKAKPIKSSKHVDSLPKQSGEIN